MGPPLFIVSPISQRGSRAAAHFNSARLVRCIICERKAPDTDYIENPSIQAINKLSTTTSERCGYGESEWEHLNSRLHGSSANELLKTEFIIT